MKSFIHLLLYGYTVSSHLHVLLLLLLLPNVMAALANIDGTLCSTPQSLADAQYWSAVQRCQDAKPVEISWGTPN